ncbi:MAG TPA: hypothetical protein V6D00_15515 [Pantanalinema sp.]
MPSRIPTVQVRFSDPRINKILDVLARSTEAHSKSKLLETLSVEPIMRAFQVWLAKRIENGATYSELHAETGLPVPELMSVVEPKLELDEAEITRHLEALTRKTGVDVRRLWAEAPGYELGPR